MVDLPSAMALGGFLGLQGNPHHFYAEESDGFGWWGRDEFGGAECEDDDDDDGEEVGRLRLVIHRVGV